MTMTVSPARAYSQRLIGEPGSRFLIPTPALILDVEGLDANIARMAKRTEGRVALRPHAKTHKSAWIARKQIAAGAAGVCCAKLGEAEALVAASVRGILLTSPIVGAAMADRVCAVAAADAAFACVVDHRDTLGALAKSASRSGIVLKVVIDVDVGLTRSGVSSPAEAIELANVIRDCPFLEFAGVQGYGGHWQHIPGFDDRRSAIRIGMAVLAETVEALRGAGHGVERITGGGTGTVEADLEIGVLNELQPGSYVFMDAQYYDALGDDADGDLEPSLWVSSQVVSINAKSIVTVDAGLKAFATDGPPPRPSGDRFAASSYVFFGDEHGALTRPAGQPVMLGERVEFLTPHCDPTVDRYSEYHVVQGDRLIDIVPIEAARASR